MENRDSPSKNESPEGAQDQELFSSVKYYLSGIVREDVSSQVFAIKLRLPFIFLLFFKTI